MALSAIMTDLYQLTMLAGYFREEMHAKPAVFDLFFRTLAATESVGTLTR